MNVRPGVGVIGLGVMGAPMARNIMGAGLGLHVAARRPESAAPLVADGARWHDDAASLARACDVVVLMVPDLPQVIELLDGPTGLLAGGSDRPGGVVVAVASTVSPAGIRNLAEDVRHRTDGAVRVIDTPVSGGEEGAVAGTLSIMVGAESADYDVARPALEACGHPELLGPVGAGQVAKACNQMIVAATVLALGEAAVLAERSGLDVGRLFDLLGGGYAASRLLEVKKQRFAERDYHPGGAAKFMIKDLAAAAAELERTGTASPQLDVVRQAFTDLVAAGFGEQDTAVVQAWVESLHRPAGARVGPGPGDTAREGP